MTPQRAAVLEALRDTVSHPTAEELQHMVQERLPRVSLGTVYRNLQVLVDEGYAVRLPTVQGSHRFDGNMSRHHHAICGVCGAILDVHDLDDDDLTRTAQAQTGFSGLEARVQFVGVCGDCDPADL